MQTQIDLFNQTFKLKYSQTAEDETKLLELAFSKKICLDQLPKEIVCDCFIALHIFKAFIETKNIINLNEKMEDLFYLGHKNFEFQVEILDEYAKRNKGQFLLKTEDKKYIGFTDNKIQMESLENWKKLMCNNLLEMKIFVFPSDLDILPEDQENIMKKRAYILLNNKELMEKSTEKMRIIRNYLINFDVETNFNVDNETLYERTKRVLLTVYPEYKVLTYINGGLLLDYSDEAIINFAKFFMDNYDKNFKSQKDVDNFITVKVKTDFFTKHIYKSDI